MGNHEQVEHGEPRQKGVQPAPETRVVGNKHANRDRISTYLWCEYLCRRVEEEEEEEEEVQRRSSDCSQYPPMLIHTRGEGGAMRRRRFVASRVLVLNYPTIRIQTSGGVGGD